MTGDQAMAIYSTLYRPSREALRRELPEIGEGLVAQFVELHEHPTADGAEQLAANLQGAARLVIQFRAALGQGQP